MFFIKKTETSILLTKQDVEDCGLKLLPPTNEIYEKQEYHYSISWVRGDLKPIIQSKSGRHIIGDGWNKLSKIPYENQKTLEHFVIGFHQVNGVYVTKYHQVGDEVKVLVKETNRTIKLEDVSEEDLKKEDDLHLRKCLYKEGFIRNDVYPSSGKSFLIQVQNFPLVFHPHFNVKNTYFFKPFFCSFYFFFLFLSQLFLN